MNLKRNIVVIGIFLMCTLLLLIVLFFIFNKFMGKNADIKILEIKKDLSGKSKEIKSDIATEYLPEWLQNNEKIRREWTRLIKEKIAQNRAIKYYGKVVDQFNEPVENANVIIQVITSNKNFFRELKNLDITTTLKLTTDKNGIFVLKSFGTSFMIKEISKNGYRDVDKICYLLKNGKNLVFDQSSPRIFKIIKLNNAEVLYHCRISKCINIGENYCVNFKKHKIEDHITSDTVLSLKTYLLGKRKIENIRYDVFDWGYELTPINGKIIEADSETYIAPDSGYKNSIFFSTEGTPLAGSSDSCKTYIIKDEKNRYSKLKLRIYMHTDYKRISISLEYFMNPKPKYHNLSYDVFKSIYEFPE